MDFTLFLHIWLAILLFGGLTMLSLTRLIFARGPRVVALPVLHWAHRWLSIVGPSSIVVVLVGISLVQQASGLSYGQTWIWLSIALWVANAALAIVDGQIDARAIRKIEASPEGAVGGAVIGSELRLLWGIFVAHAATLVAIVALMVYKPGL